MYRPADTKLHNSIFLPVLWSQNYLFSAPASSLSLVSAPAPSLSLVSAPAPALAKYCHLKLYCTIKVFLVLQTADSAEPEPVEPKLYF